MVPAMACCLALLHILVEDCKSGWHSTWGRFPAQGQLICWKAKPDTLLDSPQAAHPWNMALIYLFFPAPASAFTGHLWRGLGWTGPSCPGTSPELAEHQENDRKRNPSPAPVPPSPAGTDCTSFRCTRTPKEMHPTETKVSHFPTQPPP